MAEEQDSQGHIAQKKEIMELFDLLLNTYGLSMRAISEKIKKPGYDALIDYSKGDLPKNKRKFLNKKIKELEELVKEQEHLRKMDKLENNPKNYPDSTNKQPSQVEDLSKNKSTGKSWLILDLLSENDPEPYSGEFELVGRPFKKAGNVFMILDPNDSKRFREAIGVVPSYAPGYTGYEFGVIKINLKNCTWGKHYYIWDTDFQPYFVSIYEVEDKQGYYKLVHADPVKYPDKTLHESEILVVFKVTIRLFPD